MDDIITCPTKCRAAVRAGTTLGACQETAPLNAATTAGARQGREQILTSAYWIGHLGRLLPIPEPFPVPLGLDRRDIIRSRWCADATAADLFARPSALKFQIVEHRHAANPV